MTDLEEIPNERGSTLMVSEIFGPTLQGEGSMVGCQTHFVRLGGCDFRCSWCDSTFAVQPHHRPSWERLDIEEIVRRVQALGASSQVGWVTISGGNPALFKAAGELCLALQSVGYRVAIETQGSVAPRWLADFDHVCLSPKPPSSWMDHNLDDLLTAYAYAQNAGSHAIKIVVFDEQDLAWASRIIGVLKAHRVSRETFFYLSAGTPHWFEEEKTKQAIIEQTKWLVTQTKLHPHLEDVRILPQLHVLLWGNARGK